MNGECGSLTSSTVGSTNQPVASSVFPPTTTSPSARARASGTGFTYYDTLDRGGVVW